MGDNSNENTPLYSEIYSIKNLVLAWKKARKGKTKRDYVIEFEKHIGTNFKNLHEELKNETYKTKPLKTFILRDPKIRKISKSNFRDRIVHHALIRIIEPIFDKSFIYDCCANRKGKGTLFALKRFDLFKRKTTNNLKSEAFCLKADIKHYFQEVDHEILINIIKRKVKDEKVILLIQVILNNNVADNPKDKGMPLGNLTSQFFANVYLNELDYFIKYILKAKFYIRYVDDFVILHYKKEQLETGNRKINDFLKKELKLELHQDKSKVISLSKGIDFVGFRNFYYYRLLRKRNARKMLATISRYKNGEITNVKMTEIFQGWNAYAKWGNSYNLRKQISAEMLNLINLVHNK